LKEVTYLCGSFAYVKVIETNLNAGKSINLWEKLLMMTQLIIREGTDKLTCRGLNYLLTREGTEGLIP